MVRLEEQLEKLNAHAGRNTLRSNIEDKMRAWMPPSKRFEFRQPPLGLGTENLHIGAFEGLDEFGRIRFKEANGIATYADAEIIGLEN